MKRDQSCSNIGSVAVNAPITLHFSLVALQKDKSKSSGICLVACMEPAEELADSSGRIWNEDTQQ